LEAVLLFLGELIVEVFLSGLLEALWDLASATYKVTYGRKNHHPLLAALGYLALGATIGAGSLLLRPERMAAHTVFPGISLVLGPLLTGGCMRLWGDWRRARGHATTNLATFLGGAAFALGLALVRFGWAR
jgi:hypothetical protein